MLPAMFEPTWLPALRESSSDLFTWLDPGDRDPIRQARLDLWHQVPWDEGFLGRGADRFARCTPLALGPERLRMQGSAVCPSTLWADPDDPDRVFLGFGGAFPSPLWAPAEATPEGLASLVDAYLRPDKPSLHDLPRTVRMLKQIEVEDPTIVRNSVLNLELWMDDALWGPGHVDDPWRHDEPPLAMLRQMVLQRDADQDHDGRTPGFGARSLFSRSALRVEAHGAGLFVFEVRYAPAPTVEPSLLDELFGLRLPADAPVDLMASLLRSGALYADELPGLEEAHGAINLIGLRCALEPAEPATVAAVRALMVEHAADDAALGWLESLASVYGMDALHYVAWDLAAPGPLKDQLAAQLSLEETQ